MNRKHLPLIALGLLLGLASCATQPIPAPTAPGFILGLLHGLIAPFALIGHLFDHDIRMYAFPNAGGWYDFGFFLGVGALGGSAGRAR